MTDRPGRAGPKYRYIADDLRDQIAAGKYKPGDRLPSKAAMVRLYGGGVNTVERAVEVLRQEGLVESVQGAGMFVLKAPARQETGMAERLARLEKRFDDLECQVMDTRAAVGLDPAVPEDEAAAR